MPVGAAGLASLLTIGSDISGLVTGLNQGLGLITKFGEGVKSVMDTVVQTAEKAVQAIKRVSTAIAGLANQSARLDSMRDSFNKMAAGAGASGQELLAAMNEATLGMAKDADLIQSSMTAMMLINQRALGDVTETIPKLAQIATAAARALGEDVGFMFDSIARGIGRASPMILDNIGLTIRLGEVYGNFATQLGKTAKQLTMVEKQTALTNAVLDQYDAYVTRLGISTGGLATKTKQYQKSIADLKDTIGQAFMPLVQAFTQVKADLAAVIVQKLIPAFRMLGRVLSEVFGTKNPFWRWVEGDIVQQTTERIQALYNSLIGLRNLGPDFAGAVSEAMGIFNKELGKLEVVFQRKIAKIQSDLADKLSDLWSDFRRNERRKEDDHQETQRRSKEDHLEDMRKIQKRYDEDIFDAIRNRDARALLNLLRNQKKEITEKEAGYEKSAKRAEDAREKERVRASQDARLRASRLTRAAGKREKELEDTLARERAKLEKERNKQLSAARATYDAEVAYLTDQIEKQKELREKQMEEVAKIREEMAQPLPPFFQALKAVLTPIWLRLQQILEIIKEIISGETPTADILEKLGLSPEKFEAIVNLFTRAKSGLVAFFNAILKGVPAALALMKEMLGPTVVVLWKEYMDLLPTIIELLRELAPILIALAAIFGVVLVEALRIFLLLLLAYVKNLKDGYKVVTGILKSFEKMVIGVVQFIAGFVTGNMRAMGIGIRNFTSGVVGYFKAMLDGIFYMFTSWIRVVLAMLGEFGGGFIQIFQNMWNVLVRHSIIPDMLGDITNAFGGFFNTSKGIWQSGWGELAGTAEAALNSITPAVNVGSAVGGISAAATANSSSFRVGSVNVYGSNDPRAAGDQVHTALTNVFTEAAAQMKKKRN